MTLSLVAAIVEFLAFQRPVLEYASTNLGYWGDPPYQWAQEGSRDIAGSRWTFRKVGNQGYRLQSPQGVVLEFPDVLGITVDSILITAFSQYLATKGVNHVVLERDEVGVDNHYELSGLLGRLVETGLLSHPASGEFQLEKHVDLSAAVETAIAMGHEHFEIALDRFAVEGVFLELLWGPRKTWPCTEERIITPLEAANLLIAHLHSRLIARETPARFGWEVVGAPLQRALMNVLPQFGPRALAIELIAKAMQTFPRFDVRDYSELEGARAILHDVCKHLHENNLVELTFRVGTTHLPADPSIDLCVLLEQVPMALAAIATRQPFAIEMSGQELQTSLAFTASGDDYAMSVVSSIHEGLEGGSLTADELLVMLLAVRTRFLALLLQVAPELEHHPRIHAWLRAQA